MRRKDREMDREFGLKLIDSCEFGNLALCKKDKSPLIVPLSLVRQGSMLYFHSAQAGEKVEELTEGKELVVSFVNHVKVPNNYSKEELELLAKDPARAKELISNVFTTEFASAIVRGRLTQLESREDKIQAMKLICHKYTADKMEYFDLAIEAGLSRVNIYSISIDEISCKRKKYDSKGLEMKWMRSK